MEPQPKRAKQTEDNEKPSSSGGLLGSIFGGEVESSSSIFESSNPSFHDAVQNRIAANLGKQQASKSTTIEKLNTVTTELSVDGILAKRKTISSCEALKQITAASPHQDVTDEEFVVPPEEKMEDIARILKMNGVVVVQNVVSKSLLDDLSKLAENIQDQVCAKLDEKKIRWRGTSDKPAETFRFVEVASRCSGRMDVRYRMDRFSSSCIVENPSLMPIISSLLGGGGTCSTDPQHAAQLLYAGLIFSFPDSQDQPWHQDGMPLFPELRRPDAMLPSYAINVFLPLSDEDGCVEAGPTEFAPTSHLMDEDVVMEGIQNGTTEIASPILKQGDALLYDYGICHRGTSNLTGQSSTGVPRVRRILYLMYARPWFKEHLNFGSEHLFPASI